MCDNGIEDALRLNSADPEDWRRRNWVSYAIGLARRQGDAVTVEFEADGSLIIGRDSLTRVAGALSTAASHLSYEGGSEQIILGMEGLAAELEVLQAPQIH